MKRELGAEFFGTFALIFAGTGSVVVNDASHGAVTLVGISLTWGLTAMAMIYAIGHVSGCHINPAVTIGLWSAGSFERGRVLPYILSQCAGAVLASVLIRILFPDSATLGGTAPSGSLFQTFLLEIVLTWILMFVILGFSYGPKERTVLAGVVIGAVVTLDILFGGPISGASMNPARSLGPAIVSGHLGTLWIYLTAPLLGAVAAVYMSRFVQAE
jgi:aquaporin Z